MVNSELVAGSRTNSVTVGTALVVAGAFGFSAKAVLIKLAYSYSPQVDAITLMALRMLISLPFFMATIVWLERTSESQPATRRDGLAFLGLGLLGYYVASFLDFSGLALISAGLERLILFLYPTLVVLLSALFWRRPVSSGERVALAISYAGIVLVFIDSVGAGSASILKGSALVFASAVAFALFLMGSGNVIRRLGSVRFTAWSMMVACMGTIIHFGVTHDVSALVLPVEIYWIALLMAVFSTVVPAFLLNEGIRHIGSGPASIISSFGPVSTLALACVVLDETLSMIQVIGAVLVLSGVWFAGRNNGGKK